MLLEHVHSNMLLLHAPGAVQCIQIMLQEHIGLSILLQIILCSTSICSCSIISVQNLTAAVIHSIYLFCVSSTVFCRVYYLKVHVSSSVCKIMLLLEHNIILSNILPTTVRWSRSLKEVCSWSRAVCIQMMLLEHNFGPKSHRRCHP